MNLGHAQAQLRISLNQVQNNAPINEKEGNLKQAKLERDVERSIKDALRVLGRKQRPLK